jgi:selenocysteine lyase/cysteine desulfurase
METRTDHRLLAGSERVVGLFESSRRAYVDTATYGLPPRPTVEALQHALDAWRTGTADWLEDWEPAGELCRAQAAPIIGAPAAEIALVPAVSVGVGIVAASLTGDDEVVVPDDEFQSLLLPLAAVAERRGATVRRVPFADVADGVTPRTTLVATSHVRSNGGLVQNLDAVGEAARSVGARVVVDATHAAGILPVDAEARGLDVVVVAAYKHLLCPRGVGFVRVAPAEMPRLVPVNASWVSADPRTYFGGGPDELARDARRFDVSLAWHPWVGAVESLRFLNAIAPDDRERWSVGLASAFAERVGVEPTGSSFVGVPVRGDVADATRALAEADVAASVHTGEIRVSFHVYNTPADVDYVAGVVGALR